MAVLCCPHFTKNNTIGLSHGFISEVVRIFFFTRFDVKVIFHPQEYLQPPCELFIIFHLPPQKNLFMRLSQPVSQNVFIFSNLSEWKYQNSLKPKDYKF